MEPLAQGAEAILYIDELYGDKVLVKERIEKKYRIPEIDIKLRKERTNMEVKLITDSRSVGVNTPQILEVDKDSYKIKMEYIEGTKLKDLLDSAGKGEICKVCFEIGRQIGRLHRNDIIHGDLTTSNMLLSKDESLYFIDFGLGERSKRIEDKGVDLKVLYGALSSSHCNILNLCWENILEGYKKEYKSAEEVIKKIHEIEGRARYAKRGKNKGKE